MKKIYSKVYTLIEKIPISKVTTYGEIARVLNINPRFVGHILHKNPNPKKIPCHRVVNYKGELSKNFAFGGEFAQTKLLLSEKVIFKFKKIDLTKSLFKFSK